MVFSVKKFEHNNLKTGGGGRMEGYYKKITTLEICSYKMDKIY